MNRISSRVFEAMQNIDVKALASYEDYEIRPVLPSLVRMSLLSPLDNTKSSMDARKQILTLLVGIEIVNNIVAFLQVNYHELETELKKECSLRQKMFNSNETFSLGLHNGVALDFERADVSRKVRIVLAEIFNLQIQLMEPQVLIHSELFEDGIYLEEVIDIICISLAELPSLLNVQELVDTLLYVNNGKRIICSIVANFPDYYMDIVTHLIMNCEEDCPEGKNKLATLLELSEMNPKQALSTRAICSDFMKVPSFMMKLCLKFPDDMIAFMSGMLLGNDQVVRSWFAIFLRTSQKKKGDALHLIREELLRQLQNIINKTERAGESLEYFVQAVALLRLYCALRGIAGIKFNEDEINLIMQLITSRPPPTSFGIRFVSLALAMLIACPSLLSNLTLENRAIEWMQWLIKEDSYLGNNSDNSSFGEMLLLIAIHFHGHQIHAIGELICAALAMKIPLRPNSTNRLRQIFTQDLFTEQVVASHAVKVPVTFNLTANIPGYLPVHCIHQLLKSRTFLKHKISIKSWIYKQICNCIKPLHPVMPAVIEVYVNSLLVPNSGKTCLDQLHKPFTEDEVLHIFEMKPYNNKKHFELHLDEKISCKLTSQLLMLYYLLQYEDTRLAHCSNVAFNDKILKVYSGELLSQLPMKYLLKKAQKFQNEYNGLFQPLLRLLISNFPHLSLVDDWLEGNLYPSLLTDSISYNIPSLAEAFDELHINPIKIVQILNIMLKSSPKYIWKFSEIFVRKLPRVLDKNTPRLIKTLYRKVWLRLNSILPYKLWITTINSIAPLQTSIFKNYDYKEKTLLDPINILRTNQRVVRSPDVLVIMLRILQAVLAASRTQLSGHFQNKHLLERNGQLQTDIEREELKTSLIASQESVTVHILLESLIIEANDWTRFGCSWRLQEIRGIVCSYIHQAFISEPSLAKLVHFQTYPRILLTATVQGVPSMHICIDFLHEVLNASEMNKQIFTIDLTSRLILRYAIPKCLSIAKFCINNIITTFGLLSGNAKLEMFSHILPCIVRFAQAFPVLLDDCIHILMQTGRSLTAQNAIKSSSAYMQYLQLHTNTIIKSKLKNTKKTELIISCIEMAFDCLMEEAILKPYLY